MLILVQILYDLDIKTDDLSFEVRFLKSWEKFLQVKSLDRIIIRVKEYLQMNRFRKII